MASAISQEEFHRLQTQLIDLITANYTLMEESNRYRNGIKRKSKYVLIVAGRD